MVVRGAQGELILNSISIKCSTQRDSLLLPVGLDMQTSPVFWFLGSEPITGESELILSLDSEWIMEPTGTDVNTGTYSATLNPI